MVDQDEEFLGEIRVGRRITSTPRAAASGLIFSPGLVLILAVLTVGIVGINSTIATLFVLLLLGLTLLNIVELLGGSTERGGTASLVHESLGGFGGYLAGWTLLAGILAMAAIFFLSMADLLLSLFPAVSLDTRLIALLFLLLMIIVQVFRILPRRSWALTLTIFCILAVLILFLSVVPQIEPQTYREGPPLSSRELLRSSSWLAVIFIGLEAVLASRRQIQDSTRRVPPALLQVIIGTAFLLIVGQVTVAGLGRTSGPTEGGSFMDVFYSASFLPDWIISLVIFTTLLLAANASLMLAARQLFALSQRGGIPEGIRSLRSPFRLPPLLFSSIALLTICLIMTGSIDLLINLGACLILVPIFLLNLGLIQSRQTEPDRRRPFLVPYYPLVPLLALFLGAAIFIAVSVEGLLGGLIWVLLGLVLYQFYGRTHQAEAREGILVFGPSPDREKAPEAYRILVPMSVGVERRIVLEMAAALARQLGAELIALQVLVIPDPLAMEQGQRLAHEQNTLFQWSIRFASKSGVPIYPVTRLARSVHEGILDTAVEEDCNLIMLSWSVEQATRGTQLGRVLDPVVRRATCDVVAFAFHAEAVRLEESQAEAKGEVEVAPRYLPIEKILVTTAGGPHAPLATRLAVILSREYGATTRGVYVTGPQPSQEDVARGEGYIQQTLNAMREQAADLPWVGEEGQEEEDLPFESRVISADSVLDGIVEAGDESDLILIGASEESLIDQVLFGTLPEEVARRSKTPVLMVKKYRGLPRFWFQRAWDTISGAFPTISSEDRLEVYRKVRRSARPDVDFFIMIALAAVIATFGLLLDSVAVIIGGMLVAPLFTPILALSLAVVQGDIRLSRVAIEATLKGIFLTIGVATLLTAISPLRDLGGEVTSRVTPNLLDLAVALASGAAGAYAIARKDVATALPGVAIAAALVPPLCVVGIGLAILDMQIAGGGALLFLTNLVAIVLAGAVILLLLGFRPTERGVREVRLRRGLVASLVLLLIISIPLAVIFAGTVRDTSIQRTIDNFLVEEVSVSSQVEVLDFEFQRTEEGVEVIVRLYADPAPTSETVDTWRGQLSKMLRAPVHLRVVAIPVVDVESSAQ